MFDIVRFMAIEKMKKPKVKLICQKTTAKTKVGKMAYLSKKGKGMVKEVCKDLNKTEGCKDMCENFNRIFPVPTPTICK